MELHFTMLTLGIPAMQKLVSHKVTQTIRSKKTDIVKAYRLGTVELGRSELDITLDYIGTIGRAIIDDIEETKWHQLTMADAERGGFDSMESLHRALLRTGYRYHVHDLDEVIFYKVKFHWFPTA